MRRLYFDYKHRYKKLINDLVDVLTAAIEEMPEDEKYLPPGDTGENIVKYTKKEAGRETLKVD